VICVQWRWFSDNIWHDVVPAVLDDGMTAVTMGCGPPQCSDVSLHLYFPNANITWGIENVRVVVHMALAFWGCWGNMSLEMPTYEYNYHIHSRALVDNLTHYLYLVYFFILYVLPRPIFAREKWPAPFSPAKNGPC